jgi:DNA ligase 1
MSISVPIYKRDTNGKLRQWQYEVDGAKYRTVAGIVGGALVTTEWTVCKGKRKNNDEQQAAFEADAEEKKKLKREYRRTVTELDSVPPAPMLATPYEKFKPKFPVFCQPKLDGIRALISRHGAFSREFQPHLNVDHILEALAPVFEKNPDLMLDGELYNHEFRDNFNAITSIVRKQDPTDEQRAEARKYLQYHVYDILDTKWTFSLRTESLWYALKDIDPCIRLVPTLKVTTQEDLDLFYEHFLDKGFEGQIIRLDGFYECDKRSKNLFKRKEFVTKEYKVLDIEEGKGNWSGLAKSIMIELPDGREQSTGLRGDQPFAKKLLEDKAIYIGGLTTVEHFEKLTPDGKLRFPVAVDFHPNGRVD